MRCAQRQGLSNDAPGASPGGCRDVCHCCMPMRMACWLETRLVLHGVFVHVHSVIPMQSSMSYDITPAWVWRVVRSVFFFFLVLKDTSSKNPSSKPRDRSNPRVNPPGP